MMEQKNAKKGKSRAAVIMGIFAKHNFYANGFTPYELRTTLEDLGPTYVKIGQIMSSRTDMLPRAYCLELEKLRSNVQPLPAETVRAVIEGESGKPSMKSTVSSAMRRWGPRPSPRRTMAS